MSKVELVMLVWDLPIWIINEIKYTIYNLVKRIAIKLGFE